MKSKPDPVPHGQGVYVICHRATNSIYIGSSTNLRARYVEWKCAFRAKRANRFPTQNMDEYTFEVVRRSEGMSETELRNLEDTILLGAQNSGLKIINMRRPCAKVLHTIDGLTGSPSSHATRLGLNPSNVTERIARGYTVRQALRLDPVPERSAEQLAAEYRKSALDNMPVALVDIDGRKLTYKEAAEIVGCAAETMKARIKRIRARQPDVKSILIQAEAA